MSEGPIVLSVKAAADISGLPIKTLYKLIAQGRLKEWRDGRTIYVYREALLALFDQPEDTEWANVGRGARELSIVGKTGSGSRR